MTANNESRFIKGVVLSSVCILAVMVVLGQLLWIMREDVAFLAARTYADGGNYAKAMELVEGISDSDVRLGRTYDLAEHMYANEHFSQAAEVFDELGDYGNSRERYMQCSYELAAELYRSGDLQGAVDAFARLGDYSDSIERQRAIAYEIAVRLYDNAEYPDAVIRFLSLGDYRDCADKAYRSAIAMTGDEDATMAILSSGGLPPEELQTALLIVERRADIGGNAIAAGAGHTVLRHADGTVSACGDNSQGQCDVRGWSGIIEIRAGAHHTVGLKKDGTVVAVGDNSSGQCDVSEWQSIVAIAAGDCDTIGLTADGTVLSTGYHKYSDIERAAGIRAIFAGSYALAAQTDSGTVIASHKTCAFTAERQIIDAAIHTGYYAAIQSGGGCLSSLEQLAEWKGIAFIAGGPRGIVASDVEGKVHSLFFRQADNIDLSSLSNVSQCAAGTEHYVFLTTDGAVYAFGDNSYGQCSIEELGSY